MISVKTTRKLLIIEKYNELINKLKEYITVDIFPSLDDIDIADLVFFVSLNFAGSKNNYQEALKDLIDCHNIKLDDETFIEVYNVVHPFILWFKNFN